MVAFDICFKAKENWDAAKLLEKNGLLNASVNRLYYALFQVPYQKLVEDGKIDVKKHGRKHQIVIEHLRQVERRDIARCFRSIHACRGKADYEIIDIDPTAYGEILKKANKLRIHFNKF